MKRGADISRSKGIAIVHSLFSYHWAFMLEINMKRYLKIARIFSSVVPHSFLNQEQHGQIPGNASVWAENGEEECLRRITQLKVSGEGGWAETVSSSLSGLALPGLRVLRPRLCLILTQDIDMRDDVACKWLKKERARAEQRLKLYVEWSCAQNICVEAER